MPALIDEATVVVVPSLREGFGLIALEGMLGRRPVIASRVGGLPEVLGEDGAGVLVEPESAGALAEGIRGLLRDPRARRGLPRRGVRALRHDSRSLAASTNMSTSTADSKPNMPPEDARFRLAADRAVARVIDGDAVVIDTLTGRYYSLEGPSQIAWSLLVASASIGEVAWAMRARFDTGDADVTGDVARLADDLVART